MSSTVPPWSHHGTHIERRGCIYRYRRRLPGENRGREVVVSLRTSAFREAEHRAALLDREFEGALARARAEVAKAGGKADLNAILRGYLREVLDGDGADRLPLSLLSLPVLEHRLSQARDALVKRDFGAVVADMDRLAALHALPPEHRFHLGVGVLEARVQALLTAIRQVRGDAAAVFTERDEPAGTPNRAGDIPGHSPRPETAPAEPPQRGVTEPLASALVEPYFVRRETIDSLSHHDMSQERTTLRLFLDVCGDRPINGYGRGDVTQFLNTLRQLPRSYGKSPKDRDRSAADIIAAAPADAPRLSDKTVKRHHTALSQFLRFAVDAGHLSMAERMELTAKHRFRDAQKARDQRDAWTMEELQALFRSPLWTGCAGPRLRSKPGPHIIRDARFWLPILGLYHGARLEELADLYRRDIECVDGIWTIRLVETEDNGDAGARSLKTEAAIRTIPLHPELKRLGFLAYVAATAPNPDDPLFPDLAPQGRDRKRGPRFTRFFGNYRKTIGLYRENVAMHSFRHNAITRLSERITTWQQKRHRNYLMGHAGGETEGDVRYDKRRDLKAMAATQALLTFPEIDLSHLYVAKEEDAPVLAAAE